MFKIICVSVALLFVTGALASKHKTLDEVSVPVIPPTLPTPSPNSTTSTTETPTTSTTEKPTTTSTTPKPTTSTTEKPTTTSTTPKPTTSTTEKPTTTSTTAKPTTSTTEKPTTTSTTAKPTPAPTTPPPPTPKPAPVNKVGTWNVTETVNNQTTACIVASMLVDISVQYSKVNPKNASLHENNTQVFSVPANAISSGKCGNHTQTLVLSWVSNNASLSVHFGFAQHKSGDFVLSSVNTTIPVTNDLFPGIDTNVTSFDLHAHNLTSAIPSKHSFLCRASLKFPLVGAANHSATLNLTRVQFQAFAHVAENKFDAAIECAADQFVTPDIVPIAVGVALAALVAVVLVAYVIGRRRSNASGYVSM